MQFMRHEGLIVSVVLFCDLEWYIERVEPKLGETSMGELRDCMVKGTRGVFATRNCVRKSHQSFNVLRIHFGQQT